MNFGFEIIYNILVLLEFYQVCAVYSFSCYFNLF